FFALLPLACDRPSPVRAFQATERTQLVGGPSAIGEEQDFVIENDRIRIVVALQAVELVGVTTNMSFETELILEPHQSWVTMRTRVNVDARRRPLEED